MILRLKFDPITFRKLDEKVEVVDQMIKMYEEYIKLERTKAEDDDFQLELKIDPVLRFVAYVLVNNPEFSKFSDIDSEAIKERIIRYITAAFYSSKGTGAVFQKMTEYLGLEYEGDVVYTQRTLDFKLVPESVKWVVEEERFVNYFNDFLLELLFVGEGEVLDRIETYGRDTITMEIKDTVQIKTDIGIDLYRYHIILR